MAPRVSNKKNKMTNDTSKSDKATGKLENADEENNSGFSKYLKSEEGMSTMKMFVVINSLVMLLTMGLPAMKQAYEIVVDWLKEMDLI